jgi:hypothetical protein
MVLAARVDEVTPARLDDDRHTQRREPVGDLVDLAVNVRRVRIEMPSVQGQGHAVVAEVGEHGQGVVQPMVGEPVGPVREFHVGETFRDNRRASG